MSDPTAHGSSGVPLDARGRPRRADPPVKSPEQIAAENEFYSKPVCPCEQEEPIPLSEYDVSGEWVTYTGEVNESIFDYVYRHTADESDHPALLDEAAAFAAADEDPDSLAENIPIASALVLEEAVASASALDDSSTESELIDEWDVDMAKDNARDAAARSEQAANNAAKARRRADAARTTGTRRRAAQLAREAVRFDQYAAQTAQEAIDAEEKAARIAEMYERANEVKDQASAPAPADTDKCRGDDSTGEDS